MVVRQNVLSTLMLKNVKFCNENVRMHLATAYIINMFTLCRAPLVNTKVKLNSYFKKSAHTLRCLRICLPSSFVFFLKFLIVCF